MCAKNNWCIIYHLLVYIINNIGYQTIYTFEVEVECNKLNFKCDINEMDKGDRNQWPYNKLLNKLEHSSLLKCEF